MPTMDESTSEPFPSEAARSSATPLKIAAGQAGDRWHVNHCLIRQRTPCRHFLVHFRPACSSTATRHLPLPFPGCRCVFPCLREMSVSSHRLTRGDCRAKTDATSRQGHFHLVQHLLEARADVRQQPTEQLLGRRKLASANCGGRVPKQFTHLANLWQSWDVSGSMFASVLVHTIAVWVFFSFGPLGSVVYFARRGWPCSHNRELFDCLRGKPYIYFLRCPSRDSPWNLLVPLFSS